MGSLTKAASAAFFLLVTNAIPLLAQEEPDAQRVRVFLDCQTFGCDFDLTRREIAWVAWVRNREDADVHVLVTSIQAGAGTAYEIAFIGRGEFLDDNLTLSHSSSSTDTSDERRRALIERFKLGLVRYASGTPASEFLQIQYRDPDAESGPGAAAQVTPENDPWNLWVFSVNAGGSFRGQSLTSSVSVNGSLSASRTSEEWKFRWGARVSYSEDDFELGDGTTLSSLRRSSGTDVLLVRSVGPHWGVGGRASLTSSTFSNQDIRLNVQPTVEYNIFPYAESSRRQFTFQYRVGVSRVEYDEETVFEVTEETLYEQSLTATLALQQPWGNVSMSLTGSHFLDDIKKNRVTLFGLARFRIVRGLSFFVFSNVSRVRDQVFLPRRGATDEEVLLRRRALQTDFSYSTNFSISYTFGSIFNNIVNPRFDGGGGGFFFF